jgi:hypothetical protein
MLYVDVILTICSPWHHGSQNNLSSKIQTFYDVWITYIRLIYGVLFDALQSWNFPFSLIAEVSNWLLFWNRATFETEQLPSCYGPCHTSGPSSSTSHRESPN